jgi:hypothetical protein
MAACAAEENTPAAIARNISLKNRFILHLLDIVPPLTEHRFNGINRFICRDNMPKVPFSTTPIKGGGARGHEFSPLSCPELVEGLLVSAIQIQGYLRKLHPASVAMMKQAGK